MYGSELGAGADASRRRGLRENLLAASRGGRPPAAPPCSHTANPGAGVCPFGSIKQGYFLKV